MIVLRAEPARRIVSGARPSRGRASWLAFAAAIAASATLHAAVLIALAGRGESAAPRFEVVDVVAVPGLDLPQPAAAMPVAGLLPSAPVQSVPDPAPIATGSTASGLPTGFVAAAAGPPAAPPQIQPPTIGYPGVTAPVVPPPSIAPPLVAPPAGPPAPTTPPAIGPLPVMRPPGQTGAPLPSLPALSPPVAPPAAVTPPTPPAPAAPVPRRTAPPRGDGTQGPAPARPTASDPSGETSERREPLMALARPGPGASAGTAPSPGTLGADAVAAPFPGNPAPSYPVAARRAQREGRVVLRVAVSQDGVGRDIRLAESSGTPSLDDAALQAVRAWRFVPAVRNGVAADDVILVPVVFRLTP